MIRGEPDEASELEPTQPAQAADVLALEERLVARAKAGDRDALTRLIAPHVDQLYSRVVLPRVGDPQVAADLVRETMMAGMEKLELYQYQGRSIYYWLRQIAVNKVCDHHRKVARTRRLSHKLAAEPELHHMARPDGFRGPEAALIAAEEQRRNRARIEATLAAINPRYREAITLRIVEERPREECAHRLSVTVATFDVLFFRAIRAFRKAFEE